MYQRRDAVSKSEHEPRGYWNKDGHLYRWASHIRQRLKRRDGDQQATVYIEKVEVILIMTDSRIYTQSSTMDSSQRLSFKETIDKV